VALVPTEVMLCRFFLNYHHFTGNTGKHALAGTANEELEDSVGAKFYCLHALADES